jgi:hypothetical protein
MTMMIFSRRAIQERLFALEHVLNAKAHQGLIERLERPGRDRLSAMWEVVWLAALNAVSPLKHEEPLADGSKPDFRLLWMADGNTFEIIGDITAASDKGLHDNNPINQFWSEVVRLARKYGLNPNHFYYNIGYRSVGEYGDSRTELLLPPRSQLMAFLKAHVEPFIEGISQASVAQATLPYSSTDVAFTVSYNQKQEFGGGSSALYDVPYSLTKTPIFTALVKKAKQLGAAPSSALRVVVLCDAGCHGMQDSMLMSDGRLTAAQVAKDFLRKRTSVDMVLLVTIETVNPMEHWNRFQRISATFVVPPERTLRPRLTPFAISATRSLLEQAIKLLPKPMINAQNASNRCEMRSYGSGLHGGYEMSETKIRISSRLVLELLSGKTPHEEFDHLHGWDAASETGHSNPLARALDRGAMIDEVTVIPGGDEDDDWLEFHLREADPAITPFRRSG